MSDGNNNITTGEILEVLNTKADVDLNNIDVTSGADSVIEYQTPTAENDYTWYRKYKSGWVEQGGFYNMTSTAGNYYVSLPITMSDINYQVLATYNQNVTNTDWTANTSFIADTISQIKIHQTTTVAGRVAWEVKGMAA